VARCGENIMTTIIWHIFLLFSDFFYVPQVFGLLLGAPPKTLSHNLGEYLTRPHDVSSFKQSSEPRFATQIHPVLVVALNT